jgi:hypothetical protein
MAFMVVHFLYATSPDAKPDACLSEIPSKNLPCLARRAEYWELSTPTPHLVLFLTMEIGGSSG